MPWSRDDLTRLVELEAHQQGVDPRLAVALAEQESGFNPTIRSPKGAYGVFQLMPGTARQLKVNIDDPADNIRGGVTYLKQQLDAFGGDPAKAIAAYNAGPGVVQAYKGVPPYKETRGLVSRVMSKLGPSSAEAATPQAPPQAPILAQAQAQPQAAGMSRLQELEAHLARLEGQAAPQPQQALTASPMPPTATSTPEQDAAYRASQGQQGTPPASQTAPTAQTQPGASQAPATPDTSWTPGMRFQALPSIQQLEPAERTQRTQEFVRLTPALQEEFLRSEEPPSDLTVDIEKPSTPQARGPVSGTQIEPATEGGVEQLLADQRTGLSLGEHARVGAATGIDIVATAGGAALGGLTSPVTGFVGPIAGAALGGAAGTRLNTALGLRRQETPLLETPYANVYPSDVLGVGASVLFGLPAVVTTALRRSQAGKAIVAADEATTLARQEWQQATATAKAEQAAGRAEAYQAAERRAREAQVRYQTKVEARDATIAANEQTYQDALAASKAEVQAEQTRRYGQARTETMEEVGAAQTRQQQYQQAVTGQEQALTQARAVPGRYTPETPSWVMYEKFGDAAKDAVVDLTPAKAALAEVRASRGVLPDGTARPLPSAVESIAANLEKATGDTSFKTIREELRRLGPLTRSQDGNVRGAAKQLYGIYADVLEASPLANDLLRNANATFRKEMAVRDVAEWLTPGRGIVRIDNQGRETINVGALMTRLEKTVADDSLFRRSFAPDELDALRKDLRGLAGTPTMPRGAMPPAATPELLPGAAPNIPASMTTPTPKALPPEVPRPRVEMLPGGAGPGRRGPALPPEPAPVTPREMLGERPKVFKGLTKIAARDYLSTLIGIPPGLVAGSRLLWRGGQQLRYGMARALLGGESRRQVLEALSKGRGVVSPALYGGVVGALSEAERKALLRETREAREKKR